jgi:signal transduction protein with GAF and PtsI domain
MIPERLRELERQVSLLLSGDLPPVPAAEGSPVVTADGSPTGRAIAVVLDELRREVPYDSCSVQQLRGTRLVIVGGVGFKDLDVILGEAFDIANSDMPNGEVVHRGRPVVVPDTEQYRAFRRGLHVGAGIRSWVGVPMLHDDKLVGVLAMDKAEPDFYCSEHAAKAFAYASLVASAIVEGANTSRHPATP